MRLFQHKSHALIMHVFVSSYFLLRLVVLGSFHMDSFSRLEALYHYCITSLQG